MKTTLLLSASVLSAALALGGCDNSNTSTPEANNPSPTRTEGPAERAGRAVDNAARDTADAAKRTGERIGDATDRAADNTRDGARDVNHTPEAIRDGAIRSGTDAERSVTTTTQPTTRPSVDDR